MTCPGSSPLGNSLSTKNVIHRPTTTISVAFSSHLVLALGLCHWEPYKGTTVSSVLRSLFVPVVDQFRKAVKAENSNKLASVDAADLLVYANKAAFDKRHAEEGKEGPLKSSHPLKNLGKGENEALVVVVPENTDASSDQRPFAEYLKGGRINRPDKQVLTTIATRFPVQLMAAIRVGETACIHLYETVKALPSSFTRGVIQSSTHLSINGPMSLAQPNILIAADLESGASLLIKLLRMPQTTRSESTASKRDAVSAEINACSVLSENNISGLVKCEIVQVTVQHSEGLDVSPGVWAAIKMKRYMSSLSEAPQLSERWLYRGFSRISKALKAMHGLNLVHMDVKADNVLIGGDFEWDLADFGSTREIGAPVWSFTKVLNPYAIPANATVIPAMDYVLLCVLIAVELKKEHWKDLRGQHQNVQEHLILERLNSIIDVQFKREVVDLFKHNLMIVQEHFQSS